MALHGHLDQFRYEPGAGWVIEGWAADDDAAAGPRVAVLHGSEVVGETTPTVFRADLPAGGMGFSLPVDDRIAIDHGPVSLTLRVLSADAATDVPVMLCADPIVGWLDRQDGAVISGWVCNVFDPATPVSLDILLDDVSVDRVSAGHYRGDLLPFGWEWRGFEWILPEPFIDGRERRIAARVTNGRTRLASSLATVTASREALSAEARNWFFLRRRALREAAAAVSPPLGHPAEASTDASEVAPVALPPRDQQILLGAALPSEPDAGTMAGRLVGLSGGVAHGWIVTRPGLAPPVVDILIDGRLIERVPAGPPDPATGRCAFAWPVPAGGLDGSDHRVEARLTNASIALPGATHSTLVPPPPGTDAWRAARIRHAGRRSLEGIDVALAHHARRTRPTTAFTATDLLLDRIGGAACPPA